MRFCANCTKKNSFHAQLSQKLVLVLRKLRKKNSAKPRKTHCVSCAKIAQKFAKKKICAKIAQILRKRFTYFVETLDGLCVIFFKQPRTYLLLLKISWKIDVLISNRVSQLVIFSITFCIMHDHFFIITDLIHILLS